MGKILYADKETIYQNPQIPANQKVQSGDMNSIKNAINQEGRYTPTTYNSENGQFTCQMVGNLEVGDTIQVILDLTSQDVNEYYDISISIDDGATYYDLVDTKKGFVLNGSDFEYLEIYLKAVFNGTSFVLISPDRVTNSIELVMTGNENYGSGVNYYYFSNLTVVRNQKGTRFSVDTVTPESSGTSMSGVKIGEGITEIEASGQMQFQNKNTTSSMYILGFITIINTANELYLTLSGTITDNTQPNQYCSNVFPPRPAKVQEGYVVGMRGYKSNYNGSFELVSTAPRTGLVVKEVR